MLFLCLLIEQVNTLLTNKQDFEITKCIDETLTMLGTGVYDVLASEMPEGIENDFDIVIDILNDIKTRNDERFNNILSNVFEGFGISPESNKLPDDFRDNYKKSYQQFFADNEFIFENYIVNHILMEGFPFNYGKDSVIMANYADLLAKYNIVEFLVVGVCQYHNEFDEWNIIDCVSSFSRCYDHAQKGYLMMD